MPIDITKFPPPPSFTPEGKLEKGAKAFARETAGALAGTIEGITEAAGGFVKGAGEAFDWGANIFNKLGGVGDLEVVRKATTPVGDFIRDKATEGFDAAQEIIEKSTGKESVLASPVRWVNREIVAPIITYQSLVGKLGKAKSIFSAMRSSNLPLTGTKGFDIMSKVLPYASQSIARTEIQRAASQGRLATVPEIGIGIVADAAFSTASHYLKKMAPELFRIGINPKGKDAKDIVDKATKAVNKGYWGTMKNIKSQAEKVITKSGSELDELLKGKGRTILRSDIIKEGDEFIKRAAETGDETTVKAIIKRLAQFANAGNKKLTPKEALDLKRVIAKEIATLFDKGVTADPKIAAQKQALVALWQGLDNAVNSVDNTIKGLNQEMNLAFSLLDPIEKSLKKPIINTGNLISIFRSLPTVTVGSSMAQTARGLNAAAGTETARFGLRGMLGEDTEQIDSRNKQELETNNRRVPIPARQQQGMPDVQFRIGSLVR